MSNYLANIVERFNMQVQKGIGKYGQVLEQNNTSISARLEHLAQELTDGLAYIEWAKEYLSKAWHFPAVKFVSTATLAEQIKHFRSELKEVCGAYDVGTDEDLAMELWDRIHSGETALRMLELRGVDIVAAKEKVFGKNDARGYYRHGV